MRKYSGYEAAEAFTGEYEQLEAGGYVCIIKGIAVEEKEYGELMRIKFDIVEGDMAGFYRRVYMNKKSKNADAKWPGMYYQTIKETDLRFFKGFITAIEESNSGFIWNWNENELVGKLFGGIFGEEEYLNNKNEIKTTVKCRFIRNVDNIRNGNFTIPAIKKVTGADQFTRNGFTVTHDDDLPF